MTEHSDPGLVDFIAHMKAAKFSEATISKRVEILPERPVLPAAPDPAPAPAAPARAPEPEPAR